MSKLDGDHPKDVLREPPGPETDARLDHWLRDALDDRPEVAHRLARRALESAVPSPGRAYRRWRPLALTAAAALLLAVITWGPVAWGPASPQHDVPHPHASQPKASTPHADPSPAPPAELRLSNETGFVTVTSTAGSQWIILPGAAS